MYIPMRIHMFIRMSMYIHMKYAHRYILICIHMVCVCARVYVHVCAYFDVYVYAWVRVRVLFHICTYAFIHVYIHIHTYMLTYMYICTRTHVGVNVD